MKNKVAVKPEPSSGAVLGVHTAERRGTLPCQLACPAGVDVPGYVALVSQNRFKEALQLIREKNPLPSLCSRVCTRPCETACIRAKVDKPIAINALKRFVADYEAQAVAEEILPAPITRQERIAIVGSGPAGLTAAWQLLKLGYKATIFEALPVAGGMLAVGIPEYRLPKKVLQAEIETIQKLGVEIRLNTPVGKDGVQLGDLWKQGYEAIFMAVGASRNHRLSVPGEDLEGVYSALSFLRDVNLGREVRLGEKVAVVGAGNVALDSARTALRLGAGEVFIVYRRSRQEMPVNREEEIEEAEEEGVKFHYLSGLVRLLGKDGGVTGLECVRMELGVPDASGRRRATPVKGSEFVIEADNVIAAIGQTPDLSFSSAQGQFKTSRTGTLDIDPDTFATSIPGVFAGGDVVSGPATVGRAIATGRRAAISIHNYLSGESLPVVEPMLPEVRLEYIDLANVAPKERATVPTLPVEERLGNFREVNLAFSPEAAVEEAKRCLFSSYRVIEKASKDWRIRAIEIVSFLAFVYAAFGYVNSAYLHLVSSFWLNGYSDKIAIIAFGIWRIAREKNGYIRKRIAVVVSAIAVLWISIPYFTGSTFFNHHIIGSAWFFAYLAIILFFGRRADCGWNCPCVGIRDTAGDPFRESTLRGKWWWRLRHLKWAFMGSLVVYLFLVMALRYFPTAVPLPPASITGKYIWYWWSVTNGMYFASLLIVPWTGSRNYCRFFCPWGALYGLIGNRLGFYKIVADRGKCMSCHTCVTNCYMGIPIRSLVEGHGEVKVADCVGCGRCVTACPNGALRFIDIRDYLGARFPWRHSVPTTPVPRKRPAQSGLSKP
jgi:NADPH-dependent glutamate synthase beta subunit-like oxidoreductase/ferredoxin